MFGVALLAMEALAQVPVGGMDQSQHRLPGVPSRGKSRSLTRARPTNQGAKMSITPLHDWNLTPSEAIALQKRLASRVERADRVDPVRHLAGVDIGFEQGGEITRA
ncbi:MAG: endonuclease V, partial [Halomonas sp.]|nr:endonuclease V [Halomonas sp.]